MHMWSVSANRLHRQRWIHAGHASCSIAEDSLSIHQRELRKVSALHAPPAWLPNQCVGKRHVECSSWQMQNLASDGPGPHVTRTQASFLFVFLYSGSLQYRYVVPWCSFFFLLYTHGDVEKMSRERSNAGSTHTMGLEL